MVVSPACNRRKASGPTEELEKTVMLAPCERRNSAAFGTTEASSSDAMKSARIGHFSATSLIVLLPDESQEASCPLLLAFALVVGLTQCPHVCPEKSLVILGEDCVYGIESSRHHVLPYPERTGPRADQLIFPSGQRIALRASLAMDPDHRAEVYQRHSCKPMRQTLKVDTHRSIHGRWLDIDNASWKNSELGVCAC